MRPCRLVGTLGTALLYVDSGGPNTEPCDDLRAGLLYTVLLVGPFTLLVLLLLTPLVAWVRAAEAVPGGKVPPACEAPDCASQAEPTAQAGEESPRTLPWRLQAFVIPGNALIMINFTVVMPASVEVAQRVGRGMGYSGLLIGAYAGGALVSLPLMSKLSRHSYRGGLLLTAAVGVLGNLSYALAAHLHGFEAVGLLILARVTSGIGGGAVIVMQNVVLRCSCGQRRVRAVSQFVTASSFGMMAGPGLSSAARLMLPSLGPETAPSVMMLAAFAAFGVAVALYFPSQAECLSIMGQASLRTPRYGCFVGRYPSDWEVGGGHAVVPVDEGGPRPAWRDMPWFLRVAWLQAGVQCALFATRAFKRVAWETAALHIISKGYGLGSMAAGFLVPLPFLPGMSLPWVSEWLHRTTQGYIACMEALEVLGLLMMLQVGAPGAVSLSAFLVGSCFFNTGNWAQSVAYTSMRPSFALPGHAWLSLENSTSMLWGCSFVFNFAAPVVASLVLENCLSQNLLPALLGIIDSGFLPIARISVGMLVRRRSDFMEAVKDLGES